MPPRPGHKVRGEQKKRCHEAGQKYKRNKNYKMAALIPNTFVLMRLMRLIAYLRNIKYIETFHPDTHKSLKMSKKQ